VDIITDFTAGAGGDLLNLSGAVIATLSSGLAVVPADGFDTITIAYYLSGVYTAPTGVFTVLANGAGNSTLIIQGTAADTALAANTTMVVLVGVNSADLVVTTNVA
jgi:hypothetical protein